MKLRNGFISNSSTTSFCICGINYEKISEKLLQSFESVSYDRYDKNKKENIIQMFHDPRNEVYTENWDIGIPVREMHLDETRREFYLKVYRMLSEIDPMITLEQIKMIQGSWHDGY